jgi:ankyrin repeat protein
MYDEIMIIIGVEPDSYTDFVKGGTPLHFACANGHTAVVCLLVEAGGERLLHMRLKNGCSSLHLAAENGHVDVVNQLIMAVPPAQQQSFLMIQNTKNGASW